MPRSPPLSASQLLPSSDMDAAMPIGFFENTQEIYAEVASYTVVPPEKIRQYWNAYTTTFRRLFDPSAFRLENFWWHVWGSERLRNMSGPALARLFEEFSNGPTIVPLSSPVHRHAGDKPRGSNRRRVAEQGAAPARSQLESSNQGSASSSETKKSPTPSSSRPPPPHPILKKSRGPSASGRRPTARFVSPPASDDGAAQGGEAPAYSTAVVSSEMPPPPLPPSAKRAQSVLTTTSAIDPAPLPSPTQSNSSPAPAPSISNSGMQPPPPGPVPKAEKPRAATGRKVVASSPASRRKPVLVRRPSSQSSTESESGSRVPALIAAPRRPGSKRPTPTASQLLGSGSLSPHTGDPGISAKTSGKRPAIVPTNQRSMLATEPLVAQAPQLLGPQRRSTWDAKDSVASQQGPLGRPAVLQQPQRLASLAAPRAPPPIAGFVGDQTQGHGTTPMARSSSNNTEGQHRSREPGMALLPAQPTSSVATSTTTVLGQFDSATVTAEPAVPEPRDLPDQVRFGSQAPSSVLETRLKPTPPHPAPPIPFGRSRSELTLLLERGKPRKGQGS